MLGLDVRAVEASLTLVVFGCPASPIQKCWEPEAGDKGKGSEWSLQTRNIYRRSHR